MAVAGCGSNQHQTLPFLLAMLVAHWPQPQPPPIPCNQCCKHLFLWLSPSYTPTDYNLCPKQESQMGGAPGDGKVSLVPIHEHCLVTAFCHREHCWNSCASFCGFPTDVEEDCKVTLMSALYGQQQMIIAGEVFSSG